MNRSPLYYPMNRGGDLDAGGAADLQTDIMRFMAILALCLVAVFALVQSIPLEPTTNVAEPERMESIATPPVAPQPKPEKPKRKAVQERLVVPVDEPIPAPSAPRPEPKTRQPTRAPTQLASIPTPAAPAVQPVQAPPKPAPRPVPAELPVASAAQQVSPAKPAAQDLIQKPASQLPAAIPRPTPASPPSQPVKVSPPAPDGQPTQASDAPVQAGFTLRFASDTALTRLVVRNAVGLYAISPAQSLRMSMNRGSYSFWPASVPNQYHEMDPGTVPASVVAALRRSGSLGLAPNVKWAVTLPTTMRRQLDDYLAEYSAGALVIEADGTLRLEP